MATDRGGRVDGGAPERDRRDDGRPEQARPRDRTGRPLPYGTTGVPLIEEHDPATVDEALALGIELWGQQRYFEAHECLEQVWHAAPPEDRDLWQGVIQIAVAGVHLQRDNPTGASALFTRAADRLRGYPDGRNGIDVAGATRFCDRAAREIGSGRAADVDLPPFPARPGGAWAGAAPEASDTPATSS